MTGMNLNTRAAELCAQGIHQADRLRITVSESDAGSKLVDCGVKAAGGIRDKAVAEAMIEAGATRLGTSSGVAIVKGAGNGSDY